MNLKELCDALGVMAKAQDLINYSDAGSSLAEINPLEIENWPLIFIIPSGNHTVFENTTRYDLTIYFLDRLLEDNSNSIDIYSSAIENLKNILIGARSINGVVDVESSYSIRCVYPEKLNDRVAGAYAQVRITVSNETICFVEGEDIC